MLRSMEERKIYYVVGSRGICDGQGRDCQALGSRAERLVNNNMVGGFVVRSIERNEQSNDVCHERVIASPIIRITSELYEGNACDVVLECDVVLDATGYHIKHFLS